MKLTRRLRAIMFTDIQGYTALMQRNEREAVEVRKRHREVFEIQTARFSGEIIHYYGDGTLSIFNSSVQAVRCAASLQAEFLQEPQIPVRIGIHTGDILITEDDIIGDSVNLASRIESLAVPGSVLLSGKVVDEIHSHPDLPVLPIGSFHLKNDRHKREIFALQLPGLAIPDPKQVKGKLEKTRKPWWTSGLLRGVLGSMLVAILLFLFAQRFNYLQFPSGPIDRLGVLPFTNLMENPQQSYIVQGVHEAIISELQLAGIDVVPRTSMMSYRDTNKSIGQIVSELHVGGLLEGSVLRNGDQLNIELRLIDGENQNYIWSQSYPTEMQDLFSLYKEATKSIAGEIKVVLTPEVEKRLAKSRRVNAEAMDLYLKGRQFANLGSVASIDSAINYYLQVIQIDPQFGQAYSGLVESSLLKGFVGLEPYEAHTQFRVYAQKAMELDDALTQDHHLLAMIKVFSDWDWQGAEEELKLALLEYPDSYQLYDSYCQLLWAMGRLDESVAMGEKAVEAGPQDHFAHCDLAWAYYFDGKLEAASQLVEKLKSEFDPECVYHNGLDFRLRSATEVDSVSIKASIRELERLDVHNQWRFWLYLIDFYIKAGRDLEAWALLEKTRNSFEERDRFLDPAMEAIALVKLGDFEQALDALEDAYHQRSFFLIYTIKADPWWEPLRSNPRYAALLRRMELE